MTVSLMVSVTPPERVGPGWATWGLGLTVSQAGTLNVPRIRLSDPTTIDWSTRVYARLRGCSSLAPSQNSAAGSAESLLLEPIGSFWARGPGAAVDTLLSKLCPRVRRIRRIGPFGSIAHGAAARGGSDRRSRLPSPGVAARLRAASFFSDLLGTAPAARF